MRTAAAIALALAATACAGRGAWGALDAVGRDGSGSGAGTSTGGSGGQGLTYSRDVQPILAARCGVCHAPGSFAPFSLQSYADIKAHLQDSMDAVQSGYMPPWAPDDACNSYVGDRSLSAADRATLSEWAAAGAPEGDAMAAPAAVPEGVGATLPRVDLTLQMPQPYRPQLTPDEYRCFLLDWPATTDTFVTGYSVRPGNAAVVHHVVAFVAQPNEVASLQALDGQDGEPGYPCFGGSGSATSLSSAGNWLGIWAPGSMGTTYGDGSNTGLRVQPGSKIVLQLHYHLYGSTAGVTPDRTAIDLMLASNVAQEGFMLPFGNPLWLAVSSSFTLPAGAPDTAMSFSFTPFAEFAALKGSLPQQLVIHNAGLHMHQLGRSASLRRVPATGATQCILSIPAWDFHWQDIYKLRDTITVQRGDKLTVECHFDNSAANQPVVGGAKQPPVTVHWGEKSSDEMCLGLFYVTPG